MKIVYKQTAVRDLQRTCGYIREHLKNPRAAAKLSTQVLHAISLLADNPHMGMALADKFDMESELLYFIVGKQLVFYRVRRDTIEIVRILDGRSDYLAVLFG